MVASSTEPPPKYVKFRYRALAYVRRFGRHHESRPRATSRRSFTGTGGARQLTNQQRISDSGRPRPVVRLTSKRSFTDSNVGSMVRIGSRRSFADLGVRPMVRISSKRSFADSIGSNSGIKVAIRRSYTNSSEAISPQGEATQNRRTSRSRKGVRKNRGKRRHRFLASLHNHGGHRLRLFCGCCVEQDVVDPADSSSFHWGAGFDDTFYETSIHRRLSKGTKFRLALCGLHLTTRGRESLEFCVNISSVDGRPASFDSGFGFTCASPVSCPPPLGLAPARQPPTTLELCSRDGNGSGKFTLGGLSSTGFKRKAPSSASYPSYIPTTPPSPFMNDFLLGGTFNNTRARSRVSVGCNGYFLSDDDPSNVNWYRRCSSGEVKSPPISIHLPQVREDSLASEAEFNRELSPKRYKKTPRASGTTSGVLSLPSSAPTPAVVTSPSSSSPTSISLLSRDGSWLANSGITLVPLPPSPPSTTSRFSYVVTRPPQSASSALQRKGESGCVEDDNEPPTKRRRSTSSSSNSSGGFGFENMLRASIDEIESPHMEDSTNLTTRSSLRLTRSHSPRTLKGVLSPGTCRRNSHRSRSHSTMFPSRNSLSESVSSPPTPAEMASRPSIVFIDCPQ